MILDTCALLWLTAGGAKFTPEARDRIESATSVFISAISAFEIGVKCRRGKLILPARPGEWLRTVLEHHAIGVIPVDVSIATAAAELPEIHSDPFDRLIIATARIHQLPVVTGDAVFARYGIEAFA